MAKHSELQGRKKNQIITNIKKGSSMPAASEKTATKTFVVAPGVRMGAPDGSGALKGGDSVELTKTQAEWCMANGFIDSILPAFDDAADDSETKAGSGSETKGDGAEGSDGASSKDATSESGDDTSRRKKASL